MVGLNAKGVFNNFHQINLHFLAMFNISLGSHIIQLRVKKIGAEKDVKLCQKQQFSAGT